MATSACTSSLSVMTTSPGVSDKPNSSIVVDYVCKEDGGAVLVLSTSIVIAMLYSLPKMFDMIFSVVSKCKN